MNWADIEENWASVVDLIVYHFPYTERMELMKIGGELTSFARYLAGVHDLTLKEALEAVEFILLRDGVVPQRISKAA
ncbi:MAG: hypothetical protein HKN27_10410 [Silicimonas sp.]|nr:hypothetical protein [Silicimonas sp.]